MSADNIVDQKEVVNQIEGVYQRFKLMIGNKKLDSANILIISTQLIKLVETYKGLDGDAKKKIVLAVLLRLVEDQIEDENDEILLKTLVNATVPAFIDTIVGAMNGEIKFDKIKKTFAGCMCC